MDREGTKGFSVTVDQLLQNKVFWVPSLDVYVAAGDGAPSFAEHQKQLEAVPGQAHPRPDAARAGGDLRAVHLPLGGHGQPGVQASDPAGARPYRRPDLGQRLYKFGIDRGAGVWNDYGNPDRFRFWFDFGDLSKGLQYFWKGQRLQDGLPVITTTIEQEGLRYEVEQFAYPLDGPPEERRGDIPMVLLQKLTVDQPRSGQPARSP